MAKTDRKYKLIEADDNHLITEGTMVGVISGTLKREKTTSSVDDNGAEHWFGFAQRNLVVDNPDLPDAWKANINGSNYYFNKFGVIASDPDKKVYVVVDKNYGASNATKGLVDAGKRVDMTSATTSYVSTRFGEYNDNNQTSKSGPMTILRPKDHFALAAMQALIPLVPNPMGMSYGTVSAITELSYTIAQCMYDKAIEVRNTVKNKVDESTKEIYVNPYYDLDEVSDVVAYNIANNINRLAAALDKLKLNQVRVSNQLPIWYNELIDDWCAYVVSEDDENDYETIIVKKAEVGLHPDNTYTEPTIKDVYDYIIHSLKRTLYWKPFDTHLKGESAGIVDAISKLNSLPI